MLERDGLYGLLCVSIASWCNGSTRDSGSLCLGSNPSEAEFPLTRENGHQKRLLTSASGLTYGAHYAIRSETSDGAIAFLVCGLPGSVGAAAEEIHKINEQEQGAGNGACIAEGRERGATAQADGSENTRAAQ